MKIKKTLLVLTSFATLFSAVSCESASEKAERESAEAEQAFAAAKEKALADAKAAYDAVNRDAYDDATLALIDEAYNNGVAVVNATTNTADFASAAKAAVDAIKAVLNAAKVYANGVKSYVAASYDVRAEILGILEAYAYEHFLTGFSFIDDGGYAIRRPEVKTGTDNYITGYGWATMSDGEITADLASEENAAWKRYYHTFETSDPAQINYADDKGSVVGDLIGYVGSAYWGTRMNETKDGYEWYGELSKDNRPTAINANANTGLATKYKFRIKTGDDGLVYNTMSNVAGVKAYAGQKVEAEDYLTMYKMKYTAANGWARATEDIDGSGSIKGTAAFYNSSSDGYTDEAWSNVGLTVSKEGGEWYMNVEFNTPCSQFYAMYYLSSSMYTPCPMGFIKDTLGKGDLLEGAKLFGKTNLDEQLTPKDTFLSCGPYVIEEWVTDDSIVFKKNDKFTSLGGAYNIAGVHFDILEAINNDPEAAIKEFEAGNLHACGIPSTKLATYRNYSNTDPEAGVVGVSYYTPGEGNYKLNVNSCTQELWNQLFGVEGSITQTAEDEYWQCEPAMANSNFLLGLSYSLDRATFAATLGRGPSIAYFGDGYLSDPEDGVSYNSTEAHAKAISKLTATNPYGYDLETATAYFNKACEEFIANGTYKQGDTIKIEIAWQTTAQFTTYGDPIIGYWESAFNAVGANYGLTLDIENWAGAVWSDVYYSKMMVGQYDIGFGSISGNSMNPLNFLEVLKSDNSSGFTLNWGADTSEVNLEFEGELWSFDALWQATETGGFFSQGQYTPVTAGEISSVEINADGQAVITVDTHALQGFDDIKVGIATGVINGYYVNAQGKRTYYEEVCELVSYDAATGIAVFKASKEATDLFSGDDNYYASYDHYTFFDLTYDNEIAEVPISTVEYLEFYFDEPAEEPAA